MAKFAQQPTISIGASQNGQNIKLEARLEQADGTIQPIDMEPELVISQGEQFNLDPDLLTFIGKLIPTGQTPYYWSFENITKNMHNGYVVLLKLETGLEVDILNDIIVSKITVSKTPTQNMQTDPNKNLGPMGIRCQDYDNNTFLEFVQLDSDGKFNGDIVHQIDLSASGDAKGRRTFIVNGDGSPLQIEVENARLVMVILKANVVFGMKDYDRVFLTTPEEKIYKFSNVKLSLKDIRLTKEINTTQLPQVNNTGTANPPAVTGAVYKPEQHSPFNFAIDRLLDLIIPLNDKGQKSFVANLLKQDDKNITATRKALEESICKLGIAGEINDTRNTEKLDQCAHSFVRALSEIQIQDGESKSTASILNKSINEDDDNLMQSIAKLFKSIWNHIDQGGIYSITSWHLVINQQL